MRQARAVEGRFAEVFPFAAGVSVITRVHISTGRTGEDGVRPKGCGFDLRQSGIVLTEALCFFEDPERCDALSLQRKLGDLWDSFVAQPFVTGIAAISEGSSGDYNG